MALQKAQATQVYAGLKLWPASTTAQLVQAQLVEDGIYPNAETIFAEVGTSPGAGKGASAPGTFMSEPGRTSSSVTDLGFDPNQPRDPDGRWSGGGGGRSGNFSSQLSSLAFAGYGKLLDPARAAQPGEKPVVLAGGGYFFEEEKKFEKEEKEIMGGPPPAVETPEERPLQIDPLESKVPGGGAMLLPATPSGGSAEPKGPALPSSAGQAARAATEVPLEAFPDGSFSIIDWAGYPDFLPQPTGPFRLLQGNEYAAARTLADKANKAIRAADPTLIGFEIHEIQPIKFGGSPTDPQNKTPLNSSDHTLYTTWWWRLQRTLEK